MRWFRSTFSRLQRKLAAMVFQGRGLLVWRDRLPNTRFDYAKAVGDGRGSSLVMAVGLWLTRTFPEAPLRVQRRQGRRGERLESEWDHPMLALVRRPNPFYSGILLWFATLLDWLITGNAYWLKVRSKQGRVVQLWWVPSWMIRPDWPADGSVFISRYLYRPNGQDVPIPTTDVVHFRYGLDSQNMRLGLSPLASLLREIFTDDEAANYTASLLRNMGVPGVVITPGDKDSEVDEEGAQAIKEAFLQRFGGDRRGEPMVLSSPAKVTVLSFSPEQMQLREHRQLPEERVSAVLGIPAIVVGLGAGLARSTFANYAEAREAAYESNIIPTQRLFAEELATQLLPEFEADPSQVVVDFDTSPVRVLQDDRDKLFQRASLALSSGGITLAQYQEMLGLPVDPQGVDVYYLPAGITPTRSEELLVAASAAPPPVDGGQGGQGGQKADNQDTPPEVAERTPRFPEWKAADPGQAVVSALVEERLRLERPVSAAVQAHLETLAEQVAQHLTGSAKAARKADTPAVDELFDADEEEAALRALLEPWYLAVLDSAAGIVRERLAVDFTLDDPVTRAYLERAGVRIKGISAATRLAIAAALQEGQRAGEGVDQVARRVRASYAFSKKRALTIARTELGSASNEAAMTSYTASGVVVGVRVLDGDYDPECAAIDGQTFSLDEARQVPALAHPNCVRAFAPLLDAADLQEAA